jgi:hypothetical protein
MFKKLVANLPFNPSLITQVGFYSDRLRQEKTIRRMSFVFMALAMSVQTLAVISPPEKSLASSSTNLMSGLTKKSDILAYYDNPASNVKAIMSHYNLTRDDLVGLTDTPNYNIFTNDGNDWWTVGQYSLQLRSDVKQVYKDNERTVQYAPSKYVYERQWRAFDIINKNGQYRSAWQGVSKATGQKFWIVQSCGNITWVGKWKTPPPPPTTPPPAPDPEPKLSIDKSIDKSGPLAPGDTFTYRIAYRNKVIGSSAAKDVKITDQLDFRYLDVVSPKDIPISSTGFLNYPVGSLPFSEESKFLEITVKLKDPLASGTEVCNEGASIVGSNASRVNSQKKCISVLVKCPFDASIANNNPNCTQPKVTCELLDIGLNLSLREATFRTVASTTNDKLVTINSYDYDFGDDTTASVVSNQLTNEITHTYKPGNFKASVVVNFTAPTESGQTKQKAACSQQISFDEDMPLGQQKTVENITRGLKNEDAINTKVVAGDELEYTLFTLNSQQYDRLNVTISDYIGDILDYATLDLEALKASGGSFDTETKKVLWENVTIPANSKMTKSFKITMLNPIPATNRPNDQAADYDCVISNLYGDKIELDVACPAVKGIENIPNTGPGTSLLIGTIFTAFVGYFFARARLLHKELGLIRTDFATSGGV